MRRQRRQMVVPGLVAALAGLCLPASRSQTPPADSFTIAAPTYDRGSGIVVVTSGYADPEPIIGSFGGVVEAEYDIDFPVTAEYTIQVRYAADAARPLQLSLDGERLGEVCRGTTGSWQSSQSAWEEACRVTIAEGPHTVKLHSGKVLPHIVALRFDSPVAFPEDWVLDRPNSRQLPRPATEVNPEALRRAITDLVDTFGEDYVSGSDYLDRLDDLDRRIDAMQMRGKRLPRAINDALVALRREALLANPLLDFAELMLIDRNAGNLGLPRNWESNSSLSPYSFDNRLATLSLVDADAELSTLYQPEGGRFVGDVDLRYDAERMLLSMRGPGGRWQVFEMGVDGSGPRRLTGEQPDVDSYDACYLPDGRIIFTSTACYTGVPCVTGASHVAVLYVMDSDGTNIRQLCFDQEHNWSPAILNTGRVLYTRWEYTDTPHSNTRLLFSMNPDGTEQAAYYGSNSYWPNSIFYARAIPNSPTQVVAIIGGHHDNPRMGELVVFDPEKSRFEADGVVQRIPGYGETVEPTIKDGLTLDSWPRFLHPYPLSERYFLVSSQPTPQDPWGVYLVDIFDNMVLLKELPGRALLEPIPLRETPPPPVLADKVDLARTDAEVYIADIYVGDGLRNIPRGTVKSLRLFTYNFAYHDLSGSMGVVGMDGPWDIKRVMGTVPVYPDGSARFRVPANTPISVQPLDAEGKALQLMRSWMTAMPGEVLSCVGCHEDQNTAPAVEQTMALARPPSEIEPWYGPTRGFSYAREVQPVIDRHCISCHDGRQSADGTLVADLRGERMISDYAIHGAAGMGGRFSVGYAELHRYVRRPGLESDYHLLAPMEFHADTTQLVQLLAKGHHGVELDAEGWDRLVTWIDLNCPYHGTWGEDVGDPGPQRARRRELLKLYGNVEDDAEAIIALGEDSGYSGVIEPLAIAPPPEPETRMVSHPNWPFSAAEAKERQQAAGHPSQQTVDLGDGVEMEMALVPGGEYVMGSLSGTADERPLTPVEVGEPLWIGAGEVTNRQFAQFDPSHDSHFESMLTACHGVHGHPVNEPDQPVVRVTWEQARAFCGWLSEMTGKTFRLPTEAEWEYAARAGTSTPMFSDDLARIGNMADTQLSRMARDWYIIDLPIASPSKYDDWIPKDATFDDGSFLSVASGGYQPNAWGIHDMHGNVAEWTSSAYEPYPYLARDGREDLSATGRKVVRGGSWHDRPFRCTSSFRTGYQPYQPVYNVGFRVVCETDSANVASRP